jgi:UDP-2,3-diacylglucosamine pyrophosphatase LpxH
MIVVLSDLHFSESESTQIGNKRFNRNLSPELFKAYFAEINQFAKINGITKIHFVLAGDILEISRSALWLEGSYRPYVNNSDVLPGSGVEKKIIEIIRAIRKEENVAETLALFRNIQEFFDMDVVLYYTPGNHDRLSNATPKIRETVCSLFYKHIETKPFDNYLVFNDENNNPFCLVRHGHEYDQSNFSLNIDREVIIPKDIPNECYGNASLGDIITIEFGAALSWYFVKAYGPETILKDEKLLAVYQRLMAFDDVRPTTAWLSYLLTTPGVNQEETWKLIRPSFTRVINILAENQVFLQTLKQLETISPVTKMFLIGVLKSGIFKKGIPFWLIRLIMRGVAKSIKLKSQVKYAEREELIIDPDGTLNCVISGHTHMAEVSLLSEKNNEDRYYINTGTWRNIIPATKDYKNFGELKALTKVFVFFPKEKDIQMQGSDWSFHYMSGTTFGNYRHL